MRDSTMHPDLAAQMRRYDQRIEALEMAQRGVRGRSLVSMAMTQNSNSAPASLGTQGNGAAFTGSASYLDVWFGDFIGTGYALQGKVYHWLPPGHTMDVRVRVIEVALGATAQTVYEVTGITATGDGSLWDATIPDTALVSTDIRGALMRIGIEVRKTVGADSVGVAVSSIPFNSPE